METMLNKSFEKALRLNWDIPCFSDYEGDTLSYKDVSAKIARLHEIYEATGVKQGTKIILLGRNSSQWAIAYLSIITYGAVIVPILPDFKTDDIHFIVNHCEAEVLLISESIFNTLDKNQLQNIHAAYSLDGFNPLIESKNKAVLEKLTKIDTEQHYTSLLQNDIKYPEIDDESLGILSYTSGTTGFSKGVMIRRKSLLSNIQFAQDHMPLKAGDKICSFLPLAHIYGQLFEFLFPYSLGCHITFLKKMPTPAILTKAFGEIKPDLILSVPLIIEKIYKKRLSPVIKKPMMRLLLATPGINLLIRKKVNKQLSDSFGGKFFEMVVGGAALNKEVEKFLRKIKFRFTIGYGMTECAPLISYASWNQSRIESAGQIVDRMRVRIDSTDPFNEIGEIQVKGDNVMMGYYKDEKATKESFTDDGWLHTGDLGVIDKDDFIYIKGRSKNMLLGANGKNIYPEEIETRINNLPIALESVVIMEDAKLVALVYPDPDYMKQQSIEADEVDRLLKEACKDLNKKMPKYMQISHFKHQQIEFEKTPKKNIKRFMYS